MGNLVDTLSGSETLYQLQGFWKILRERLKKGVKYITKYYRKYCKENIFFPVSTVFKLYQHFDPVANIESRIKEFCTHIPIHYSKTQEEDCERIADALLEEVIPLDKNLLAAFSDHKDEDSLSLFSYNAFTKEREEVPHTSSLSIENRNFIPPPLKKYEERLSLRHQNCAGISFQTPPLDISSEDEVQAAILNRDENSTLDLISNYYATQNPLEPTSLFKYPDQFFN